MVIYGPGLSLHAVPFIRLGGGGIQTTESNWHNSGISRSNCPSSNWTITIRRRRRSHITTCKSKICVKISFDLISRACCRYSIALIGFLAAAVAVIASNSMASAADAIREPPETLSNIPQTLSAAECTSPLAKDCKKAKIQRPKSRKAESCTIKCVTTCIRGGEGSPGEGPLNVRRPLVVFKQGFRTRQYCLVECSDICNLIGDTNYEP